MRALGPRYLVPPRPGHRKSKTGNERALSGFRARLGRPRTCITRQIAPRPDRLSRSACQPCIWRQPFPAGPGLSPFACSPGSPQPLPPDCGAPRASQSLPDSAAGGGGRQADDDPTALLEPPTHHLGNKRDWWSRFLPGLARTRHSLRASSNPGAQPNRPGRYGVRSISSGRPRTASAISRPQ